MGTLRFFEEVVSFKIRRTFGFADYKIPRCTADGNTADADANARIPHRIVERSTPRNG